MYTYVAKYKPCCITNDVLWDDKDCCVEWLAYGVSGKVRDSRTFDESVGFQNLEVGEVWSNSSNHTVRPGRAEAWEQTWTIARLLMVTTMESLYGRNGFHIIDELRIRRFFHVSFENSSTEYFWEERRELSESQRNYWNHFLKIWHDTTGRGMHNKVDFSEATAKHGTQTRCFSMQSSIQKVAIFFGTSLTAPRWLPFRSFDSDGTLAESRCSKPGIRKQYVIKTIIIDHNIINECVDLCVHCCLKLCIGIGSITVYGFF